MSERSGCSGKGLDAMYFQSPSKGKLSFEETYEDMMNYINQQANDQYKLIIGTDSHAYLDENTTFVTAIVVHRVGKGGRYYFYKKKERYMGSLRQRIFFEASLSLDTASRLTEMLSENGMAELNIEIHLDIGEKGETREIIKEVVGMVMGSGYLARIKPDSYGASKVADKYTR